MANEIGAPDIPEFAPARKGDVPRSALDSSRAEKIIGWKPQVGLQEGIAMTVEYFRSQD